MLTSSTSAKILEFIFFPLILKDKYIYQEENQINRKKSLLRHCPGGAI
jgi:hypothetical protein